MNLELVTSLPNMGNLSSDLQNVLLYLSAFFMVFLSFVVFSLCLRVLLWIYMQYTNRPQRETHADDSVRNGRRYSMRSESGMFKSSEMPLFCWKQLHSKLKNLIKKTFFFWWRDHPAMTGCCLFSKRSTANVIYAFVLTQNVPHS